MEDKIVFEHMSGMAFKTELDGHELIFDADEKVGGKDLGPKPKPMLLVSLAGCTGMDVVSLLKKMRVDYDDLKIEVTGELTEEHPKYYYKIMVAYHIWGNNIDKAKVEKAVNLSQERYCGVSYMLAKSSDLKYKVIYHK
jgi:putative redox protein